MHTFSRRSFVGSLPGAALGSSLPALLASTPRAAHAQAAAPLDLVGDIERLLLSLANGYQFLDGAMDAHAQGTTLRLAQSYSDTALQTTGFTYDNAVAIHAYLARGEAGDLARAQILGDALLYAQSNNFPVADGRLAQGYFTGAADAHGVYVTPAAYPYYFYGSAVGDQAWAGMALAQLFHSTGKQSYLDGALALGNWIVTNAYSTTGAGGFSFGAVINQNNQSVPSTNGKSTEHNIDTYAFFTMLGALTNGGSAHNGASWSALALHAGEFVAAMWNGDGPYFYTGTLPDGVTVNTSPIPEDCQTWSYLAGLQQTTQATIDWALAHLQATDTATAAHSSLTGSQSFTGLVFDTASLSTPTADPSAVWLEGTAHTVAALVARVLRGGEPLPAILRDLSAAARLLATCVAAQSQLGAGQTFGGRSLAGLGLVAATSLLDTGFGYTYGPSLHIGATGWYLLAGFAANPFQLGYRVVG
jgi:hypothetical protein